MSIRNFYAGADLDRAAHRRDDEAWLREALSQRRTRLVPIWRDKSLFGAEDDLRPTTIAGLTFDAADAPLVWLGSMDGHDYFAVDLSDLDDPLAHPAVPDDGRFEDLRRVGPNLPHEEGALLAYARAITY